MSALSSSKTLGKPVIFQHNYKKLETVGFCYGMKSVCQVGGEGLTASLQSPSPSAASCAAFKDLAAGMSPCRGFV